MGSQGLPYGFQAMLKEGHKHLVGLDEAVLKNIEACKQLSTILKTSMGPNGMNKMVINHLERHFVTSDASTLMTELDVEHPAAKMLVLAAKAQEQEIGDGTNFVVSFAGQLLANAEGLLSDGLHTSEVAAGYSQAGAKALQVLESLVFPGSEKLDMRDATVVAARLRSSVMSKQPSYGDVLCPLIARACIAVCPPNTHNFDVDNVRVCKVPGGGVSDSSFVQGVVIRRGTEGTIKSVKDAKVVAFVQGVDTSSTETKGTVLIHNAEELQSYSRSEEDRLEAIIKGIAATGARVVAAGSSFGEMALHFVEKYDMMAVRIPSKFELRRFCRATGATALVSLGAPTADELGFAKSLEVEELGGQMVIRLEQEGAKGKVTTVVLRGSTDRLLDDLERAVDDGVNTFKVLGKDCRAVPAGGASEMEIARHLQADARKATGLEQYAIAKFAEALEVVPRTIAETSGLPATEVVAKLHAAHAEGQTRAGLDILTGEAKDLSLDAITDTFLTRWWGIKLATDAAVTVLKVDQIIMAKQAGGPKAPPTGQGDDDD